MNGVSLLIPVYNEEKILAENVEKLVKYMKSLDIKFEIIVVSNGSTDQTLSIGKNLEKKFPGIVKIFSIPNRGAVGDAFKLAVSKARFEKIISLDIDLSVEIDFISRSLLELERNSIVIGTKTSTQKRSLLRKIPSLLGIFLINLFLGLNSTDYSIGAKAFKKSDIEEFLPDLDKETFYIVELIYFAKRAGLKIKEIPVKCIDLRESKFNIKKEIVYRLLSIFKFWGRLHHLPGTK